MRKASLHGVHVHPRPGKPRLLADVLDPFADLVEGSSHDETSPCLRTGLTQLDDALCGGFRPGEVAILGGRPSMGQQHFLTQLALFAADLGSPTLLASPTRAAEDLTYDLVCNGAARDTKALQQRQVRSGTMSDRDWEGLSHNLGVISALRLYIDDTPIQTPAMLAQTAAQLDLPSGSLIAVNDLQQLAVDTEEASLYESGSAVIRELKVLARELDVVVVATSGLTRRPEQRVDRRPELHDLRGAGDLEEVADHVLLFHRDDVYELDSPRLGEVDIVLMKTPTTHNRTITAAYQPHYARVTNIAKTPPQ